MAKIEKPLLVLIRLLRGSEMPWIGDEIEKSISIGKVPIFELGKDSLNTEIKKRQSAILGANQSADDGERQKYLKKDSGVDFDLAEQVEIAISTLATQITQRIRYVNYVSDMQSLPFGKVKLALADEEDATSEFFDADALKAATDLESSLPDIRDWLLGGAPDTEVAVAVDD